MGRRGSNEGRWCVGGRGIENGGRGRKIKGVVYGERGARVWGRSRYK